MDASPVIADRCADLRPECSTEGKVAADAKNPQAPIFPERDLGMFQEPVQTSPTVGIKNARPESSRRLAGRALPSSVIKWDPPFPAIRCADKFPGLAANKSIPGQPYAKYVAWAE